MCQSFRVIALKILFFAMSGPAFAQIDLGGNWVNNYLHEDALERNPGPGPADYLGLPLNDEGRAVALSYDPAARVGTPLIQCSLYTPYYLLLGPFGVRIWAEYDEVTGQLAAWKIGGWLDRATMTIWMDERPRPPKGALHTEAGFTTGVWTGETLTTYTTHFKEGLLRRNGAPSSDLATLTQHITRHGDLLTITARLEDPVYLTQPHVVSRVWQLDANNGQRVLGSAPLTIGNSCEPFSEMGEHPPRGFVPHYLPGKNPWVNEVSEKFHIPVEAVMGHTETLYPEYRKKLKATYTLPENCKSSCVMTINTR